MIELFAKNPAPYAEISAGVGDGGHAANPAPAADHRETDHQPTHNKPMAKKKSLLDQAMQQGGDVVAISSGYIAAGVAANTVAERLDSDPDASSFKDLAIGIGVPVAAGAATRFGVAHDMAQKAGLGMYVRGGVNGVAWLYGQLLGAMPSASDLSSGSRSGSANQAVAAARAPRRLAPGSSQQQRRQREEERQATRSGLLGTQQRRSFKRV